MAIHLYNAHRLLDQIMAADMDQFAAGLVIIKSLRWPAISVILWKLIQCNETQTGAPKAGEQDEQAVQLGSNVS